jgi:hypothetical protein
LRSGNRLRRILGRTVGHLGDHLSIGGIDHRDTCAVRRITPFAADQEAGLEKRGISKPKHDNILSS